MVWCRLKLSLSDNVGKGSLQGVFAKQNEARSEQGTVGGHPDRLIMNDMSATDSLY